MYWTMSRIVYYDWNDKTYILPTVVLRDEILTAVKKKMFFLPLAFGRSRWIGFFFFRAKRNLPKSNTKYTLLTFLSCRIQTLFITYSNFWSLTHFNPGIIFNVNQVYWEAGGPDGLLNAITGLGLWTSCQNQRQHPLTTRHNQAE